MRISKEFAKKFQSPPELQMLNALGFTDRLELEFAEQWPQPRLEVPAGVRCFVPASLSEKKAWGISAQVYELVSSRNWGIGDIEDVKNLCRTAAEAGADFVGLSPLHAGFLAEPRRCSPYSPSNRLFLNPLYLAVDKIPGFRHDLVDHEKLSKVRASDLVDYPAVAELKLTVLRELWRKWRNGDLQDAGLSRQAFEDFKEEGGETFLGHCLFESLSCEMTAQGHGSGWHGWPEEFRDCRSSAVQAYAAAHHDDVDFHGWLQWLTALQLKDVADYARAADLRFGLYLDFAVGEVPDGSSTWSVPHLVLPGMHIGAPPDAFSLKGQDWELVPLSPRPLLDPAQSHYERLIDRTARFAGALRLDHAMGLWQLFLIPAGEPPTVGAYLRYPFPEMISSLATVSRNRQTIVIGEDLGNVPPQFRPALEKAGILGYKVLYFEDIAAEDLDPMSPPSLSLACLSTHDLPPLIGWWRNDDISFAEQHGWCDAEAAARARKERSRRKQALLHKLMNLRLIGLETAASNRGNSITEEVVTGLHHLLARTKSVLVALRLADMVGESRSTNIPGTAEEYPNWRVKLQVPIEELAEMGLFQQVAEVQRAERLPVRQR